MKRGRFVTLEGVEGAGKSTLAQFLGEALRARGIKVVLTREPGGTPLAERVRQVVLERQGERVTPVAETVLMFAARAIHLENLIRPALERGEWVICDRFTDATRAYQGAGRGVDTRLIEQLAQAVHADLSPDRTLLLELPVHVGLERTKARASAPDRFEEEPAAFFERVRAGYHEIARREPERVRIIDASAPPEEVGRQALAALGDLLQSDAAEP